jgi:DNA-binding HxlR family transcriptional regulator
LSTSGKTSKLRPGGEQPADLVLPADGARLLTALGRRWAPHLLFLLCQRPVRFTELQRAVPGISATSLNDRLRDLISLGLVVRRACPGPPLASRYEATRAGQVLGERLQQMVAAAAGLTGNAAEPG